ncbi:MAG: type II secretion system GspH family protein [Phycisphaeraceae bacterium]|nr:type II secretion system GspH family protein [Phycisphaeraceae bacterium]
MPRPRRANAEHNTKKPRSKACAFTLIELLVAAAIISMLIAILPALGAARNSTQDIQCVSNQRQFIIAMNSDALDSPESWPNSWQRVESESDRNFAPKRGAGFTDAVRLRLL